LRVSSRRVVIASLGLLIAMLTFSAPFVYAVGVVATVSVGSEPCAVAYDSGKGEIFVGIDGAGTLSVISDTTNAVVATVSVGSVPCALAYDSGKGEVFVANDLSNTLSVISDTTNAVVATVSVVANPYAVAYDSGKGEVFVVE